MCADLHNTHTPVYICGDLNLINSQDLPQSLSILPIDAWSLAQPRASMSAGMAGRHHLDTSCPDLYTQGLHLTHYIQIQFLICF